MMDFLKKHDFEIIKRKLIFLYTFNILDIIFTLLLLKTGVFIEANSLMAKTVENPLTSVLAKAILPAFLIVFLFYRMQKATEKQLRQSNLVINGAVILYFFVNVLHLIWFVTLPFLL